MKPVAARFSSLSLGIVLAGTVAVVVSPIPLSVVLVSAWKQQVRARISVEAPPRKTEILEEIERLEAHPWAGVYRTRHSPASEIAIAPESGFTAYEGSRCGTCAHYVGFGKIRADGVSRVTIDFELEERCDQSRRWCDLEETLYFVPWGDLTFAVPDGNMESFCSAVADGSTLPGFPFRDTGASERLRHARTMLDVVVKEPRRPHGNPTLPREFQHLIPDAPIACRVVALVALTPLPELDGNHGLHAYDAVYSIDAGADDGLAIGMRLFLEGLPTGRAIDGRVESLDANSGRIRMRASWDNRERADELVGLRAATVFMRVDAR